MSSRRFIRIPSSASDSRLSEILNIDRPGGLQVDYEFEMLHGTFWVIAIKRRDEARSFNRQTA
jgi:uncharacterized protein YebE (UPF0316 family)